jgi:hypothetical protein
VGAMKKWIIIVAFSALCAAMASLLEVDVSREQQVIYIEGAEPIFADRVSQSDQFVFYETDGKSGMFMKADVTSVGSIQVNKKTSLLMILDRKKQQIMADMGINGKMIRATDCRLLVFLVILVLASGIMKLIMMLTAAAKKVERPSPNRRSLAISRPTNPMHFPRRARKLPICGTSPCFSSNYTNFRMG